MAKAKKIIVDPTTLPGAATSHGQNLNGIDSNAPDPNEEGLLVEMPRRYVGHEKGVQDAIRESAKEEHKNKQKLDDLVDNSTNVLYKTRNIIPFFTDEIIIDTNTVTVVNRPFFFSEHIQSVSIQNINDVYIETIPFLATISIMDVGLPRSHIIKIKWFRKNNAEKARRIITGLMEAAKEAIDITKLDHIQLVEKLEEIGKVRATKTSVSEK